MFFRRWLFSKTKISYSVHGDAELLARTLLQYWVEHWEERPQDQRPFLDMGEACAVAIAEDCTDRFPKVPMANANVGCKPDGERRS